MDFGELLHAAKKNETTKPQVSTLMHSLIYLLVLEMSDIILGSFIR